MANPRVREDTQHGKLCEESALLAVEKESRKTVTRRLCLLNSKDDLIETDGMLRESYFELIPIEVKVLANNDDEKGLKICDIASRRSIPVNSDGTVNKRHKAYEQVQKQIDVFETAYGYLAVYKAEIKQERAKIKVLKEELKLLQVDKDEAFIEKYKLH